MTANVSDPDVRIGTTLKAKWRIDALLGRGGMATVYAATHRNGKRVAIKMLHPELSAIPEVRERFLREGYVGNKVGHRGAVTVDDDDVASDGGAFLVMELLEGETLEARRDRSPKGRLQPREVAGFMDQVLDTLSSAHAQGIVHRDLKPENLFLTTEGVVKVLDFGIARLREGAATKSATTTGTLMGTPAYLPPEQARGEWKLVDGRSDLWAVGATMFELLTGRCVHDAETVPLLLLAAMTEPAPPIRTIASEVPEELAVIIDRALQRERDARWPDASAMRGALHDYLADGLAGSSRTVEVWSRPSGASAAPSAPTLASAPGSELVGSAAEAAAAFGRPSMANATVAPITSRTLSLPGPQAARGRRNVVLAVISLGIIGVIAALAIGGWTRRETPVAASAVGEASALSAPSSAPSATAPAVAPAVINAATPTAISIADLPDAPAPSDGAAARSAAAAKPLPKSPSAPPPIKPAPKTTADPFSARR